MNTLSVSPFKRLCASVSRVAICSHDQSPSNSYSHVLREAITTHCLESYNFNEIQTKAALESTLLRSQQTDSRFLFGLFNAREFCFRMVYQRMLDSFLTELQQNFPASFNQAHIQIAGNKKS